MSFSDRDLFVAHSMSDRLVGLNSSEMRELLQLKPFFDVGTEFSHGQLCSVVLFSEYCLPLGKYRVAELKALVIDMALSKMENRGVELTECLCPKCGVVVIPPLLSGTPDKKDRVS